VFPSRQIEFARLNLTYTIMSKRKLAELVQKGVVEGWDDPRMPTLAGLRRRGYTPEAIRAFCERIGVAKADSLVDVGLLEHGLRDDLNRRCQRVMAVLRPLKVVIENFPEGEVRQAEGPLNPEDPSQGSRKIPLSREIYIERDDFREDPPADWFRLAPGREVRLRYACLIRCRESSRTTRVRSSSCGVPGIRARGAAALPTAGPCAGPCTGYRRPRPCPIEVRLYDRLFRVENPGTTEGRSFLDEVNPESMLQLPDCLAEPYLSEAAPAAGARYQFERLGYFCLDPASAPGKQIWNRTVTLKDSWAKIEAKSGSKVRGQGQHLFDGDDLGCDGGPRVRVGDELGHHGEDWRRLRPTPSLARLARSASRSWRRIDLRVGVVREATLGSRRAKVDSPDGRPRGRPPAPDLRRPASLLPGSCRPDRPSASWWWPT
jgi:glutaminyl-tRNA synthetase